MTTSLPRDLDVAVSLSLSQTELATDMSLGCLLTPNVTFTPDTRLRFYSSFEAFAQDVATSSSAYQAGEDFFSQPSHPQTLAVSRVFSTSQAAYVKSGAFGSADISAISAVTSGSTVIQAGTTVTTLTAKNFSTDDTLAKIAATLGTGWTVSGTSLVFTSESTGNDQLAAFAVPHTSGTDITTLLKLTAATGAIKSNGYTFANFATEIVNTQTTAVAARRKIYAWALDLNYRDTGTYQTDLAAYVLANARQWASLCSNNVLTLNASDETCIAYALWDAGNSATSVFYHDNAQYYPDVAYMAIALGVDYSLTNATITMKFKDLVGIPTTNMTETDLSAIQAKRANCFTRIGNATRTVRDGVQSADSWYTDTKINLDNFVEQLQVGLYNVFVRTPKVPYTPAGQMMFAAAAAKVCDLYVTNGTFANRQVDSQTAQNGYTVEPAYKVEPMPLESATNSDRAARKAPPLKITAYEAGAMHTVSVSVNVLQ